MSCASSNRTPKLAMTQTAAQRLRQALLVLLLAALAATVIGAVSFTSNPSWSWQSDGPYTNDTLYCNWSYTPGADLGQDITILRNGTVYSSTYEANATNVSWTIPASATTKTDNWTCIVTLINTSNPADNVTATPVNIRIKNSPPTTEATGYGVFYNSEDIGYLFTVTEDQTYAITERAFDADGDNLTYQPSSDFCTLTGKYAGTYSCTPRYVDIFNNSPTLVEITFSASDGQNVGGRTVAFNVTPVNDPPTVTNLSNQISQVNESKSIVFLSQDEESNFPLHYTIAADSEILDRLTVSALTSDGTLFKVYYNASNPDYAGDVNLWTINITVYDNATNWLGQNVSANATYSFNLNITPAGRPPYRPNYTTNASGWAGGLITMNQGDSIQLNFSANDPDPNSTLVFDPDVSWGGHVFFHIYTYKNSTNDSADALGQANYTATNAEIGWYNLTVIVRDNENQTNSTNVSLHVVNVNDPPVIYRYSFNASNTQRQNDSQALRAYANTPFTYVINASDPDIIWGDRLSFSDNTSLFTIGALTGMINFTPDDGMVQPELYAIQIDAADNTSTTVSYTIYLNISGNTPPYFNASIGSLRCTTKAECSYNLANSTHDNEDGNVSEYLITPVGANLASFAYNSTTGMINFTTGKTDYGNHTVNITIYDSLGASNWTTMNITINNTPDAPVITSANLSGYRIVATHQLVYDLYADDDDFLLFPVIQENVTFTTNLTGSVSGNNATIVPLGNSSNMTAHARLYFTPGADDNGTFSVDINATDSFGLRDHKVYTINIRAHTDPPNISRITPWGLPPSYSILTSYANTTDVQFADKIADVNLSEGTTVLFNITVTSPGANIEKYTWTVNGTVVGTGPAYNVTSYTRSFSLYSSGAYNVSVNVSNDNDESSTFSWRVTVNNVNQLPVFLKDLVNLTLNGSMKISNYFYDYYDYLMNDTPGIRFMDPDDDWNITEGSVDPSQNERNTLTFSTKSSCTFANIGIEGTALTVTAKQVGYCLMRFNATDTAGAVIESNIMVLNITHVDNGTSVKPSTGGGGGASAIPTVIPITKKYVIPKAFNLVTPKLVTIYQNKSIDIPIIINNTWTGPIKFVRIWAETNATRVNTSFDTNLFEEIPANQSREVTLTVSNYRLGENYEVKVWANTSEPPYEDSALILLNSIEATSEGEDVKVKVTFANDLVNEHPECLELNEVLDHAKQRIAEGNLEEGRQLVDSVINGCKYLVSMQQNIQEKPTQLNPIINIDNVSVRSMMFGVLAFVVLVSLAFIIYYHYTHKIEDDI
jgi:hypothetical protein